MARQRPFGWASNQGHSFLNPGSTYSRLIVFRGWRLERSRFSALRPVRPPRVL